MNNKLPLEVVFHIYRILHRMNMDELNKEYHLNFRLDEVIVDFYHSLMKYQIRYYPRRYYELQTLEIIPLKIKINRRHFNQKRGMWCTMGSDTCLDDYMYGWNLRLKSNKYCGYFAGKWDEKRQIYSSLLNTTVNNRDSDRPQPPVIPPNY